ncbi:MAG: hypothetical protein PSV16_07185 [Flavobacterium sp.]|nr:hypothetical protein [Flavobacterium sp.]
MKNLSLLLLFFSAICFSQQSYSTTKISQLLRPDTSISSITIVTKVFAKQSDNETWDKIYESEVAVARNKNAKKAKLAEYKKAALHVDNLLHPKVDPAGNPQPIDMSTESIPR